jgi:hypothetical protein
MVGRMSSTTLFIGIGIGIGSGFRFRPDLDTEGTVDDGRNESSNKNRTEDKLVNSPSRLSAGNRVILGLKKIPHQNHETQHSLWRNRWVFFSFAAGRPAGKRIGLDPGARLK